MPRPPKCRRVEFIPGITYFKPAAVPLRQLEEVVLAVEELEAIRLKDIEGLEQEECAARMRVSRPTFFRILGAARSKVADALINGKAIRVEGGVYRLAGAKARCEECGYEWEPETEETGTCPHCGSTDIAGPGRGRCRRHGWQERRRTSEPS
ncbi:UPF0251 protein [Moorella sp. E308F]|jgi:predicted DNA-binding protein (UPF0251 family)|uniref:DUF134 domain-containing protein n=1 Tax=unclassified Neomoorella TaxID=2676739 RepID=UPI0010FFB6E0|nr:MULTISPECIES: DUF134 domain-containing protein [unclassified Moorella (in: firmicutes)]MDK2895553.1 hypothetical protein [Moorella sp. (in: firmicutes)]GEA13763.1 UPF0251 protein [Moorella sp. E308F]GEA18872.1 UPF0251 protein [Moorella sp. E306M]